MTDIVDYAHPCMMAERALKNVHGAVLKQNLEEAIDQARQAEVEVRLMRNALILMKENVRD